MSKFYIATRLDNAQRAELVAQHLCAEGHEITYKWWEHGAVGHQGRDVLTEVALNELDGVARADAVIVILPGGRGTHFELGAAIAHEKPVIMCDEPGGAFDVDDSTCAFYWLPLVFQMPGKLSDSTNMASLIFQAGNIVLNRQRGVFGKGSYGHAGAILDRISGRPVA